MSNEIEVEDKELAEMEQQIMAAEAEKAKAAEALQPAPHPEPEPLPEPESVPEPAPVTPNQSTPEVAPPAEDNPMEWANKKGFKTPEDMARALRKRDQEFHDSRQKTGQAPPPPQWQPQPDMGYPQQPAYGYPTAPPRGDVHRDIAAMYPQLNPDDVRNILPLVVDAAEAISNRKVAVLQRQYEEDRRESMRDRELMRLMQDPAFTDTRVQQEIHEILDKDQTILQREGAYTILFKQAMENMARKTLQQGAIPETRTKGMPPVTAGGGNGSARTAPRQITEAMFESWSDKEQEAYMKSGGSIVPKR
jgi:hypothetical protein